MYWILFIHQPFRNCTAGVELIEKYCKEVIARDLGTSNFYERKLDALLVKVEIYP